jgi:plastocyanin
VVVFRTPKVFVPVALVAGVLFLVGCGGGSSKSGNTGASSAPAAAATTAPAATTPAATTPAAGGGGGQTLSLSADPSQLKFDKSTLSAKAGSVTITMDNPASLPHGVAVEGNGVSKVGQTVNKGGKSTVTVDLKPGKYTFYCPVPGHRQAGMQGTLTVS